MRILILGGKGNLGSQLSKKLKESENEIIDWGRNEIDITDKELINKKINDIKPEIIINTAAYNAVDKCEESEEEFRIAKKINGDAVGYLADASIRNKSLLVHYSTDYVFDGKQIEGYREIYTPNPINKYGKTKLMGEKELISRSGKGLKFYLIRTSKLFGPKGKSEKSKSSFFDIMLKLAKEKNIIDVVDEEVSCFTYAPDLARATKDLIESDKACPERSRRRYGIYHLVNSGACTWYEAAKELFRQANINIRVNPVSSENFSRPAKRPKYSVLLNTKLSELRSWQETLREYLES